MHDNPHSTENEQELAQTGRMEDEEEQRRAYPPAETGDEDED